MKNASAPLRCESWRGIDPPLAARYCTNHHQFLEKKVAPALGCSSGKVYLCSDIRQKKCAVWLIIRQKKCVLVAIIRQKKCESWKEASIKAY